jgi:ferredoxin
MEVGQIKEYLITQNVEIIGIGSVDTFEKYFPDKRSPRAFLSSAHSFIVIGFPYRPSTMWTVSHMDELTPFYDDPEKSGRQEEPGTPFISHSSAACKWFINDEKLIIYSELNRISYLTAGWLRRNGHESFYFPVNTKDPASCLAPFEHMRAAYVAGIGTFGNNGCILNRENGPCMQFTTLLTSAFLTPDTMIKDDLCLHCGRCINSCPVGAIGEYGKVDPTLCYCCFRCIVNCPVGSQTAIMQGK